LINLILNRECLSLTAVDINPWSGDHYGGAGLAAYEFFIELKPNLPNHYYQGKALIDSSLGGVVILYLTGRGE